MNGTATKTEDRGVRPQPVPRRDHATKACAICGTHEPARWMHMYGNRLICSGCDQDIRDDEAREAGQSL